MAETRNVELVILGASAQLVNAVMTAQKGDEVWLDVESPVDEGAAVCLRDGDVWLYGKIETSNGDKLTVRVRGSSSPDRREFSRVYGAVRARYQVVPGDAELDRKRWVSRGEGNPTARWYEPDPFMDFSGSGLKFHDQNTCKGEDMLLMEISVQGADEPFRVTAHVVRIDPIPEDERDESPFEEGSAIPTHCIAVRFIDAPANAIHALVRFAERIQEAFI